MIFTFLTSDDSETTSDSDDEQPAVGSRSNPMPSQDESLEI